MEAKQNWSQKNKKNLKKVLTNTNKSSIITTGDNNGKANFACGCK